MTRKYEYEVGQTFVSCRSGKQVTIEGIDFGARALVICFPDGSHGEYGFDEFWDNFEEAF